MKKNRRSKYEQSAKRVQLISVRSSKDDDMEEWKKICEWLKDLGDGELKKGIRELAKNNKII